MVYLEAYSATKYGQVAAAAAAAACHAPRFFAGVKSLKRGNM
jgi:hypothetical protein